jgi:two-component system chemotaxis response regulator CheB
LAAAVFVVIHTLPESPSFMAEILGRAGQLPAAFAEDGQPVIRGTILVAPPDHHLLLAHGFVRVVRGPKENRHRPAIDPLFRSAALHFGSSVIGVILSGTLDDGSSGLKAIKQRGGVAIVQEPQDALFRDMPTNALRAVQPDHVVPLAAIPPLLAELVERRAAASVSQPGSLGIETAYANMEGPMPENEIPGIPSAFICPECHGALWELVDGDLLRYRCRVGHAYKSESLLADKSEDLERAFWTAIRSLEENSSLLRRLGRRTEAGGDSARAEEYFSKARDKDQAAGVIRDMLATQGATLRPEDDGQ